LGSGKSSFLNTIFSALHIKLRYLARTDGAVGTHITTDVKYRQLFLSPDDTVPQISIIDAPGLSMSNYQSGEFGHICAGRLKHGFDFSKEIESALLPYQAPQCVDLRVHCLIFVLPAKSFNLKSYLDQLALFKKKAVEKDVRYIVMLSKVDEEWPELRTNPENIDDHPKLKERIKTVAESLEIDPRFVLPALSYREEKHKIEYIDIIALRLLSLALDIATDYLRDCDASAEFEEMVNRDDKSASKN